jgi:signal peptidase I
MLKFPRLPAIVNNFIIIFMTIILIVMWIAFAPTQVGGQAYYVIVNGISMLPNFHGGDLAILKVASTYKVDDVIAYYDPQIRARIIHRIIGIQQGQYVIKGDNNSWIDSLHPTKDEILGKLWIHIPKLGRVVLWLRSPINMTLIVGILGGVIMVDTKKQPNKHGKQKNKPSGGSSNGWFEVALYLLGFLALAFLALSIFSFTQPATRSANDIEYEQTGIFYYSATSPAGIFDTEIIHSGEPIFTKLTCSIIIGYSYNISGPLQEVAGTHQLIAQITDPGSGWGRTIPLTAVTAFSGNSYSTTATVDLCQFQSLVNTMGEKTGFQPVTTLKIISKMAVSAKAGGQNVYDTFDSNLVFQFGNVHFYLVDESETDPLQSSKIGAIANPSTEANTVKFLGNELNVVGLRSLGIGGLSLSLLGLLILGVYIFEVSKRDPEALIRIRYGALIMEVYDRRLDNTASMIEVTSIDDLAKLAERQNAMILHTTRDSVHTYYVQSEGTTYRYVNRDEQKAPAPHPTRRVIQQPIRPSEVEPEPELENISNQSASDDPSQPNFIPKKITIAYNGPLPTNEQGEPVLPITPD